MYGKTRFLKAASRLTIEVAIEHRKNGRPICSGCSQVRPGYDRLPARRFEFVPLPGQAACRPAAIRLPRMNKAIDQVRAAEVKQLRQDGYEPAPKGSRWLLLKRPENLTNKALPKNLWVDSVAEFP